MKPSKNITQNKQDVRRILIFVTTLLKSRELAIAWMKKPRFHGKNAIEMINDGNLGEVMIRIHNTLF